MLSRLRFQLQHLYLIEAILIGLFFIQSLRFLIGMVYSRVGGATAALGVDPSIVPAGLDPGVVSGEVSFLVYMLALPLLTLVFGRVRPLLTLGAVLTALGRLLMVAPTTITPTTAAALTVGGGLLYIAMLVRHRAQILPYLFILGLGIDQIFRAVGNTLDPSWSGDYFTIQATLSTITVLLSLFTIARQGSRSRTQDSAVSADYGLLPFWGGIGLSGLLFLQLSLLALPNAVAGRAGVDYTAFAPFVVLATTLPVIPWIRKQARAFIGLFDPSVRGWAWMLLLAALFVFGTRFQGLFAGIALVAACFIISMTWWWVVRPQAEKERNLSGLWLVIGVLIFFLLVTGNSFTFEYAYVRNFAPELAFLNRFIPPLLRGFRGMGLALLLLAGLFASLPIIRTRRRIPWSSGTGWQTFWGLLITIGFSAGVAAAVRPPVIQAVRNVDRLRIGTYNIHSGYSEFYEFTLEEIARTIQQSGADVVLLQQVETGRLTSFGVDQTLWLARRLGMPSRFFPTNEGLQGLAILSKVEITESGGSLLTSTGNQTGVQWVSIQPDAGEIRIYNTWLGFLLDVGDGRSVADQEQDQQRQLTEIFNIIAAQHPDLNLARLALGGTFNNVPDSPLGDLMRNAGFNDPFAGRPIELSATLDRASLGQARFDYLWTRPPLLPLGAIVMDSRASDHKMAVIETLITRQN